MGDEPESGLVTGDFVTDGATFVFRAKGTPFSGIGKSPTEAFQDLMRVSEQAGPLSERLRQLARDQQGEKVRLSIIRMTTIALMVFGVVGGSLVVTAALVPKVAADVGMASLKKLSHWIEDMPPEQQEKLSRAIQRVGNLVRGSGPAGDSPASPPNSRP